MKKYLTDLKWSWKNDHAWRRSVKVYLAANVIVWIFILATFV